MNPAAALLQILWPTCCPICGRLGEQVCFGCLSSLARYAPRFCVSCGGAVPCPLHPEGLACYAVTLYEGACREIVHAMKYENGRSIAVRMGEIMGRLVPRPDVDYLVPVPLHRNSEREYNQAELIARGASRTWGIPVLRALAWRAQTTDQAQKSGADARVLEDDAIISGCALPPRTRFFLVDDVCTTGSTLSAARHAAERGGALVTGAMVWSRKR